MDREYNRALANTLSEWASKEDDEAYKDLFIKKAVTLLKQGGLVAFPTETVYGLGADAKNPDALRKIFHAKQRPMDHPLIVHIGDISQLSLWARDIPDSALQLAKAFWPGPLTLILKKSPSVSDLVTGQQDTIGLRIPNHPVALLLLKEFGSGIAAPSANRFGRISPTTAAAVREELGDTVDCILEGGQCAVGVESTIVDLSGEQVTILRPGMINAKQIENVLHVSVVAAKKNAPRVSGSHELHYAPTTKTKLLNASLLKSFLQHLTQEQLPVAVLTLKNSLGSREGIFCITMSNDPKKYAHDLYQILRELDKKNFRQIIIETVPENREWDAIRDRLVRASAS